MRTGKTIVTGLMLVLFCRLATAEDAMDKMWGERVVKLRAESAERGQLFNEGNYAMFIHWGLYSLFANKVDGKTYYGIGEWIMHPRMAGIPVERYQKLAGDFNPVKFDAAGIVKLAKDAGMKYIVITAKHHDGFAMYDSKACDFNIVKTTPWGKDPMKELAEACRREGLGLGFYYSHNQDWTFPGGSGGPKVDDQGNPADFDYYFQKKCKPQVEEITSQYGPIEIVWFDTPGNMPKKYVEELVAIVRKNQPNALVSGRAGHGLGDYETLGDMEVPHKNVSGMWESVDTTNDSWAYAWYDEYWKSPEEILRRVIGCIARGGTYMLNIGPASDGSVPERCQKTLRAAGAWIHEYPQVVYGVDASSWQHALPWGDVTVKGRKLFLSVFDWPQSGKLYLPGLKTKIDSAVLLANKKRKEIGFTSENGWTVFELPFLQPEKLVSVIEVDLAGMPEVDPVFGIDPNIGTYITCDFAEVEGVKLDQKRWMEKFGEWKAVYHAHDWTEDGRAVFEVEVQAAGEFNVDLEYSGEGRLVWGVTVEGGQSIRNQQNSSHNYQEFPIGWINFPKAGRYKVAVSCLEGDLKKASLKAIRIVPVMQ